MVPSAFLRNRPPTIHLKRVPPALHLCLQKCIRFEHVTAFRVRPRRACAGRAASSDSLERTRRTRTAPASAL